MLVCFLKWILNVSIMLHNVNKYIDQRRSVTMNKQRDDFTYRLLVDSGMKKVISANYIL
jgi:hypothetical protein